MHALSKEITINPTYFLYNFKMLTIFNQNNYSDRLSFLDFSSFHSEPLHILAAIAKMLERNGGTTTNVIG